jgi:hypothetical protein
MLLRLRALSLREGYILWMRPGCRADAIFCICAGTDPDDVVTRFQIVDLTNRGGGYYGPFRFNAEYLGLGCWVTSAPEISVGVSLSVAGKT